MKKTRGMMRATVINDLCDKRMAFLKGLKTWPTFGKGWTSRVSSVRAESLKMTPAAQSGSPPLGTPIPGTIPPAKPAAPPVTAPAIPTAPCNAFLAFIIDAVLALGKLFGRKRT